MRTNFGKILRIVCIIAQVAYIVLAFVALSSIENLLAENSGLADAVGFVAVLILFLPIFLLIDAFAAIPAILSLAAHCRYGRRGCKPLAVLAAILGIPVFFGALVQLIVTLDLIATVNGWTYFVPGTHVFGAVTALLSIVTNFATTRLRIELA